MNTPAHVAFIVDGNRRWAKARKRPVIAGHRFVVDKTLDDIVFHCIEKGIPYVTFWAFSTENWKRGERFAAKLFHLLAYAMQQNVEKYNKAGIRLKTIGDLSKIPPQLVKQIKNFEEKSSQNSTITVTIALNYGGRDEIIRAVRKILSSGTYTSESIATLSEEEFSSYLDTSFMPDPDLIIRTGGNTRLSGFMPWQSQYSEIVFTPTLMPDFTIEEFDSILEAFAKAERRFGGG